MPCDTTHPTELLIVNREIRLLVVEDKTSNVNWEAEVNTEGVDLVPCPL